MLEWHQLTNSKERKSSTISIVTSGWHLPVDMLPLLFWNDLCSCSFKAKYILLQTWFFFFSLVRVVSITSHTTIWLMLLMNITLMSDSYLGQSRWWMQAFLKLSAGVKNEGEMFQGKRCFKVHNVPSVCQLFSVVEIVEVPRIKYSHGKICFHQSAN